MADLFGVRVTGPLQAHARGFSEQLTELGYTRLPAADQLRLMAHLSRWLASRGLGAGELTPQRAGQFLRARRRAGYVSRRSQRGLTPLLDYLRGQGVTPQPMPPAACTPVQRMVGDYRIYLAQERGRRHVPELRPPNHRVCNHRCTGSIPDPGIVPDPQVLQRHGSPRQSRSWWRRDAIPADSPTPTCVSLCPVISV